MNTFVVSKCTPEALLAMADGDAYELVDGELLERQMGFRSSRIGGRLFRLLDVHCDREQLGWACHRMPVTSVFRTILKRCASRISHLFGSIACRPEMNWKGGPGSHRISLVEVISPNDLFEAVAIKVDDYLLAGVPLVWVIDTVTQKVYIYHREGRGEILTAADELSGEDIISGFRCRVADLFSPPSGVVS